MCFWRLIHERGFVDYRGPHGLESAMREYRRWTKKGHKAFLRAMW